MFPIIFLIGLLLLFVVVASAQPLPAFDFTQPNVVQEWKPLHDVMSITHTPDGMRIQIGGSDPYIHGPARNYPAGQPLWMRLRLKSDTGGAGQVFYFAEGRGAQEEDSVRFTVSAGEWEEVRVPLPPLGPNMRLRFDPPGAKGVCVVASLFFEPRVILKEPTFPKPDPPALGGSTLILQSGLLEIIHARNLYGGFSVRVGGLQMAVGLTRPMIGYLHNGEVRWLSLRENAQVTAHLDREGLKVIATARDADGAEWQIHQLFTSGQAIDAGGTIEVETQVRVSQDRSVIFLPLLVVLAGVGTYERNKGQALFAGLEYLDSHPSEVSSSEADIEGPGARRQVPNTLQITFPLMAIQAEDRYIGLIWEKDPAFSALFDSPDRIFKAGGHLMGVLFPGSDGSNRIPGNLLPYDGALLTANKPLVLRGVLIGGRGKSAASAVQHYVALYGLPPLPDPGLKLPEYISLAAHGWLDSRIRQGDLYRHAYIPGSNHFAPQPATDAALYMDWLAEQTSNAGLAARLREAAKAALARVPPAEYNTAGISHVHYPVEALIYGHVAESTSQAQEIARGLLARFEPDGSVLYKKSPDGLDYGRTHFARDANGHTAAVVANLLEAATYCGDKELIAEGLQKLRALNKFAYTVPRGAQTWEIPLHTPDILASAHLIRAYTLGYELTGDKTLLDQALYWAWTGVPFVYLVNPTPKPVGLYATIPVYGATQWKAPNWMGLPVQWCGLVYADALYRLVRHDPDGPWRQIAEGITLSGVQQCWGTDDTDLQGLLPDSFGLLHQTRHLAAINPGTVQANVVWIVQDHGLYDFMAFRNTGILVHVPGGITEAREERGAVSFAVKPSLARPYYVLVVGFKSMPQVRIDGKEITLAEPHRYMEKEGRLILRLEGSPRIEIKPISPQAGP